jgi:uncharacterized membrane protein YedE/YeeE
MTDFTPIASTLGGLLIGVSALMILALNGRIAGVSGIVGGLFGPQSSERPWRFLFVTGLLVGGLSLQLSAPGVFGSGSPAATPVLVFAGILVGVGSRLGGGCTSGHGVCGLSRLSARSLVATVIFMAAAGATVFTTRHLLG